jgi:hypothetical protein
MGAPWLVTVTVSVAQAGGATLVMVRRLSFLPGAAATLVDMRLAATRFCTGFTATRSACAVCATCTAPPPTSAPPTAHALSFAKAILTDMRPIFPQTGAGSETPGKAARLPMLHECRTKD